MRIINKIIYAGILVWGSIANAVTPAAVAGDQIVLPLSIRYSNQSGLTASLSRHYYNTRHQALAGYNGTPITGFSFSQRIAGSTVHFARSHSDQQQQQYFGLTVGNATVGVFNGNGESFLKSDNALYPDLNYYFVHGGTRSKFNFKGAGLSYGFVDNLSGRLLGVQIDAPGLDRRSGYYAGITGRWFDAGYFQVRRDNEYTGSGFNISLSGGHWGIQVNQISTATDVRLRHLGVRWSGKSSSFSFGYEDALNPLYQAGEDRRVVFRYQLAFGQPPLLFTLSENDGGEDEAEVGVEKETNPITYLIVGGAAIVGAVLLTSSGNSSNDNAVRHTNENQAGLAVLSAINPTSVAQNAEYGGWVYRNADNTFAYTSPVMGDNASVNIGAPTDVVPAGTEAVASYHTHAAADPGYDNQNFSPQDLIGDRYYNVNGFLATPQTCDTVQYSFDPSANASGCAKKYQVATDTISTLGAIPN